MSDAIWYYAQDDREHGPVTAAYITGMARTGKLRPDDLVWREGMEDWRPARIIKGLFTARDEKGGVATAEPDTTEVESLHVARDWPFDEAPPVEAPSAPAPAVEPPPAPPPPPEPQIAVPRGAEPPRERDVYSSPPTQQSQDDELRLTAPEIWLRDASIERLRRITLMTSIVGLILAMSSRGWDSLQTQYVGRLQASAAYSAMASQEEGRATLHALTLEIDRLDSLPAPTPTQAKVLADAQKRLENWKALHTDDGTPLTDASLNESNLAAREAQLNQQMLAFWLEICFQIGAAMALASVVALAAKSRGRDRGLHFLLAIVLIIAVLSLHTST